MKNQNLFLLIDQKKESFFQLVVKKVLKLQKLKFRHDFGRKLFSIFLTGPEKTSKAH